MDAYEQQIDAMHLELYKLYRGGSRDYDKIEGLWARIERLQTQQNILKAANERARA